MPFVWVIRTWCSLDTFWEAIRSSKEYDVAYTKPEQVLEELQKIVVKEQTEWKELCEASSEFNHEDKEFLVEVPSCEQIKNRPFYKFLSVTNGPQAKEQFVQNWYIERLRKQD
jgi:hypothetical protein